MNDTHTPANPKLAGLLERAERLLEDKSRIDTDLATVYAEVRTDGFDVKVFKKLIAARSKDPAALSEEDALLELYKAGVA